MAVDYAFYSEQYGGGLDRYAHLFPAKRAQIADALSELRGE